jgi:hypothetical protein
VAIVYRFLPQWRTAFFCGLRADLASRHIRLRLYYGKNPAPVSGKPRQHRLKWGNEVDLEWGTPVPNRLWNVGRYEFVWQRLPREVFDADLIILMQENSLLSNYRAGLKGMLGRKKVALWGHGLNLQEDSASMGNLFKRLYSTRVDWWFAYTQAVAHRLAQLGFPAERITVVDNAIDTQELLEAAQGVTAAQLDDLRRELNLGKGPVGLYCGAMYPDKRLDFLIEACDRIHQPQNADRGSATWARGTAPIGFLISCSRMYFSCPVWSAWLFSIVSRWSYRCSQPVSLTTAPRSSTSNRVWTASSPRTRWRPTCLPLWRCFARMSCDTA